MGAINDFQNTFEEVFTEMCDKYCKYPDTYKPEEHGGVELCESEICENCPLMKL